MAFHFRQFTVEDALSTLRIGTDAMLLGSWADPGKAANILDIGTGCGVLALMMAQKSGAHIKAIDIDEPSVAEATQNFANSPWSSRLEAMHGAVQQISLPEDRRFDFILTNPPYFTNALKSPSPRINRTRHDDNLSLAELAACIDRLLSPDGRFAVILPPEQSAHFQVQCAFPGFHPSHSLTVYPRPAAGAKRILTEFSRVECGPPLTTSLTIIDDGGKYSPEYLALTLNFHNF
jgi:tRNA1Val (adenine37-N6)-methyltransferase